MEWGSSKHPLKLSGLASVFYYDHIFLFENRSVVVHSSERKSHPPLIKVPTPSTARGGRLPTTILPLHRWCSCAAIGADAGGTCSTRRARRLLPPVAHTDRLSEPSPVLVVVLAPPLVLVVLERCRSSPALTPTARFDWS